MKKVRWMSLLVIIVMLMTMVCGCKKQDTEEGASVDSYVEGVDNSTGLPDDDDPKDNGKENQTNTNPNKPITPGNNGTGGEGTKDPDSTTKPDNSGTDQPDDPNGGTTTPDNEQKDPSGSTTPDEEQKDPSTDDTQDPNPSDEVDGPGFMIGTLDPTVDNILTTADGYSYYESNKVRVVSQNVRHSNDAAPNTRNERAPRMKELFTIYDPDLIGLQECRPNWEETWKNDILANYRSHIVYRSEIIPEGLSIYWKSSKLELIDSGHFWMSATPDVPSADWTASPEQLAENNSNRITVWVKVRIRSTGAEFYYFNIHLHNNDTSHIPSCNLLVEKINEIAGDSPALLSGDFNIIYYPYSTSTENEKKAYDIMAANFNDVAVIFNQDMVGTFPAYGKNIGEEKVNPRIDYFFTNGKKIYPDTYKVMEDKIKGQYCSDHYGIYTEMIIWS
ncbi:MAG: hypothetical protein IJ333_05940 [Clostridia bacterium]|nr:hypothetical protein [Clostridia bacterium]